MYWLYTSPRLSWEIPFSNKYGVYLFLTAVRISPQDFLIASDGGIFF
jgi:hypothetical protein